MIHGANIIIGGTGDDLITGNAGDTTYIFNLGDGHDTITDNGGNDVIEIRGDIALSDIEFLRTSANDLIITIIPSGDRIDVVKYFTSSQNRLEMIRITNNGATVGELDISKVNLSVVAVYGTSGNDHLNGGVGADILTGGLGEDSFDFNNISDSTSSAFDIITDFESSIDKINLSGFADEGINDINDLTITNVGSKTIITANNYDFKIELTGVSSLDDSDFIWG